ncbi:MAG: ATPase domain-containing protein [Methanomassiliicoccus sp.]|nr:ATPase domain-containing protein [Methanomassiliicoccus sp.]
MREPAKTIPTGVADFDSIIKGGFPAGSVILLVGDLGAGQTEFALTSAAKLAMVKETPQSAAFLLGAGKESRLPDQICYITFSRSKDEVLQELETAFNADFYAAFERVVQFRDFSPAYFRKTMVPRSWTGETTSIFSSDSSNESVLEGLVNYLEEKAPGSMIVIDSLTDLVVSANIEITDLVAVMRGMQRVAKRWGGIIYLVLTNNVLDEKKQRMLMDSVDGSLVFEWSRYLNSSKRQRYMYVEKFISLLPHLDKERIARFATVVTAQSGLVVIDTERIG